MTNLAEKSFQALADPTRRKIFEKLSKRPLAVVEIFAGMEVSRPAISQHLKILKMAGLVLVNQEGTRNFYRADTKGIKAMREYLDKFWNTALDSFKAYAEDQEGKKNE